MYNLSKVALGRCQPVPTDARILPGFAIEAASRCRMEHQLVDAAHFRPFFPSATRHLLTTKPTRLLSQY
jgi:hypothetical protein